MQFAPVLALGLLFGLATPAMAQTATGEWTHAFNMQADPKYPADYTHFDYVNVDAPKTGMVRMGDQGGFDTFNPILPKGEPAGGLGLVYETLLTPSLDEVNSYYGLIAQSLKIAPDYGAVSFRVDPAAKWQDGEPVTAEDVVWSFETAIALNPNQAQYYKNVTSAEVTAPGEVTFSFDQTGNRELPLILGQLMVLPQHWWEGTDASGKSRDIGQSTLEAPMGSGPYQLASFDAGRTITYQRNPDYWGINHPTRIGTNNFDTYEFEYFLDTTVQFEAFKGDQFDWWIEAQARRWATGFDFPAVADGRVIKELFPQDYADNGLMVGFIPNMRRDMFKDERVRQALNYAFNYEELSDTLFFGQYKRIDSYFYGLPFASSGLPQGEELEILTALKDQVPPTVFTEPYVNPVGGDSGKLRENLRQALTLLNEAGYTLDGTQLVDAQGNPFTFEILLNGPTLEPVAANLVANLALIGVQVSLRSVDSPQYINRLRGHDYDVIYSGWVQSFSLGNEQRYYFGSGSVDEEGSQNYAGIADPAIDALIDQIIVADDRDTQVAASMALDRVLLHSHYIVPGYTLRELRVAHWDRFSHPEPLPEFSSGFPTVWWYDEAKAAKTGAAR
jgi:microcin C transport system substrate-binding protein